MKPGEKNIQYNKAEKFIVNRGERVVEQIVTPRNSLSTKAKPRLTMKFLGVTICSTTLSAMYYLLYYTESASPWLTMNFSG
jgi:hypothetical protein